MPERNSSGRIDAFTMGGAASAFGMTAGDRERQRAKLSRARPSNVITNSSERVPGGDASP